MKKVALILGIIFLVLTFVGGGYVIIISLFGIVFPLNNNEDSPLTAGVDGIQAYESFLSFEDLVHNSNVAIVGEYVETIEFDSYTEKKFKVKECLYGDVGDSEIYLYSNIGMGYIEEINYTYELDADIYKTGTDYILVMEKLQSVMYDHDRYMLSTDVFLCEETNEYILYSQPIDFPGDMPIKEYIISLHQLNDSVNADNSDNSYQCDLEKMLNESSFVGQVMVQELVNEGKTHNGNTYRCVVKSLYKGGSLNTYDDGTILVVILKNTVKLNNTYVIGFSPVSENSLIYSQATDFSVYDVDEEFIKEINAYLNTAD